MGFVGLIQQIPSGPLFNKGRTAKTGIFLLPGRVKDPLLKARQVEIKEFEITDIKKNLKVRFPYRLLKKAPTYEVWRNDLGAALAVGRIIFQKLCRTRIGPLPPGTMRRTMEPDTGTDFKDQ